MPNGYKIQISEEQRVALLALLRTETASGYLALAYWEGMLEALPYDEMEDPGTTHCFDQ